MSQIVPSILTKNKQEFADQAAKVLKLPMLERIQVDFSDGVFDPNILLQITELDPVSPAFAWEAHLMIKEPQEFLDYQITGFKTIIVHFEAYEQKEDLYKALNGIKLLGMDAGICINTNTDVTVLEEFKSVVKQFQIMGIEKVGFQGTPFFDKTFDRVRQLRQLIPQAIIEVDGGLDFENAKQLARAGADYLNAGSILSRAPNILEAYEKLQGLII